MFVSRICQRTTLMDPGDIESDEPVAWATVSGAQLGERHHHNFDWTDTLVSASRFTAATIESARFERVIFQGCELSGVTFTDCIFRHCLIADVKASSFLAFVDSDLDGLVMTKTSLDRLEIQQSKIGMVTIAESIVRELSFYQCEPFKRSGRVSLAQLELDAIAGLSDLRKSGVAVQVDGDLWRLLGDLYLKEQGLKEIAQEDLLGVSESVIQALENIRPR
jgi:hypothetical protein